MPYLNGLGARGRLEKGQLSLGDRDPVCEEVSMPPRRRYPRDLRAAAWALVPWITASFCRAVAIVEHRPRWIHLPAKRDAAVQANPAI